MPVGEEIIRTLLFPLVIGWQSHNRYQRTLGAEQLRQLAFSLLHFLFGCRVTVEYDSDMPSLEMDAFPVGEQALGRPLRFLVIRALVGKGIHADESNGGDVLRDQGIMLLGALGDTDKACALGQ